MQCRVDKTAVAVVLHSAWSVAVEIRRCVGRSVVWVLVGSTGCGVGICSLAVARPFGNLSRALPSAFSLVLFLCQG